jgi:hypothetical protein
MDEKRDSSISNCEYLSGRKEKSINISRLLSTNFFSQEKIVCRKIKYFNLPHPL